MSPRLLAAVAGVLVAVAAGLAAYVTVTGDDGDGDEVADTGTTTSAAPTTEVEVPTRREPTESPTTATSAPPRAIGDIAVQPTRVADLYQPLALAVRSDDPTLYVAEQGGRVVALRQGGDGPVETVLDLSGDVTTAGNEQGLLGLAFDPDGEHLYVDYTRADDGATVVEEIEMAVDRPDPDSRRTLLTVEQPFANHNGGHLAFGPDGLLYVSLGDGGSGGDPMGNGQDLGTLLGSILRIDPRPADDSPYAVPSDNPFADQPASRGEIWAYGLRNPWRFSFDRETGAVWIGDVGQNAVEEVDFAPAGTGAGRNYGWNRLEGSRRFEGDPPANHTLPIHEYPNDGGNCSVTGGYVYRGSGIPELRGVYLFADFCAGAVMGLREEEGRAGEVDRLGVTLDAVTSFGEDHDGELYVLSRTGGVFRLDPGS